MILRWLVQLEIVPLVKTVYKERMAQNIDIFDFELSSGDIKAIATLDIQKSMFFDRRDSKMIEYLANLSR